MYKPLRITKRLKFDFADLMRFIDKEHSFTLRDVLTICKNSKIPLPILQAIIQCPYVEAFYNEMKQRTKETRKEIEYLQLRWTGDINTFDNKDTSNTFWVFDGAGYKGVIPSDYPFKKNIKNKKEFREMYGIDFTPINKIADLPIIIGKSIYIVDWRNRKNKLNYKDIELQPDITLIELLYYIFWELSFCGSPINRDNKFQEIKKLCAKVKNG